MAKEMTKKEKFELALGMVQGKDEVLEEFFKAEIALLDKKSASSKNKNADLKEKQEQVVLQVLEKANVSLSVKGVIARASDMVEFTELLANDSGIVTPQKVAPILKRLKEKGVVIREEVKGEALFKVKA